MGARVSTLLVGECKPNHLFHIWDADAASEAEFEGIVARALGCIYQNYTVIVFGGSFRYEGYVSKPDLALIAKDYSHWFIVEVELVSHSLYGHVLPQVRAFQYGDAQSDCVSILVRETGQSKVQIETFLKVVPRSVAVVANRRHRDWEIALGSHQIQLLSVSAFTSPSGIEAIEVDGRLEVRLEHLGFGRFSATDRAIRFPRSVLLPDGEVMIDDPSGASASWFVTRDGNFAWVVKRVGHPDYSHGSYLQLTRAVGGTLSIRPSFV